MVTAVEITKETEPISVEEANAEYQKFYKEFVEPAIRRINVHLISRFVPDTEIVIKREEYLHCRSFNPAQVFMLYKAIVPKYTNEEKRWSVRQEKNGDLVFRGIPKKN